MPTITHSTSPRSSCRRWRCEYCTLPPSSRYLYGNSLFTPWKILYQDDNIGRRAGFHLRDLRHVLRACEFCRLPHPGESEQSQTHAVHQRSAAVPLLAGQLCLGHGKRWRLHCQHRREFHNLIFKSPETILSSCSATTLFRLRWSSSSLCVSNKRPTSPPRTCPSSLCCCCSTGALAVLALFYRLSIWSHLVPVSPQLCLFPGGPSPL